MMNARNDRICIRMTNARNDNENTPAGPRKLFRSVYLHDDLLALKLFSERVKPHHPSLMLMVCTGSARMVNAILDCEPDLTQEYKFADTSWHKRILLRAILPEHRTVGRPYPLTPIHLAAMHFTADVVILMVRHGANIDQLNSWGETALILVARNYFKLWTEQEAHEETIQTLLDLNANTTVILQDP